MMQISPVTFQGRTQQTSLTFGEHNPAMTRRAFLQTAAVTTAGLPFLTASGCQPGLVRGQAAQAAQLVYPLTEAEQKTYGDLLQAHWRFYQTHFRKGERVHSNNYSSNKMDWIPNQKDYPSMSITEGQSYAMLKAVYFNDPKAFDRLWQYANRVMKRPDDHLFGWMAGTQRTTGADKRILEDTAADADQDIAYALLLASERWHPDALKLDKTKDAKQYEEQRTRATGYRQAALRIVQDLHKISVKKLPDGKVVITAGTYFEQDPAFKDVYVVNPSYLAPSIYRKFAQLDPRNAADWQQLARDVYPIWEAATTLNKTKLMPDFVGVNRQNGQIRRMDNQGPNSAWDACRVPIRLAYEVALGDKPDADWAKALLKHYDTFLSGYWKKHAALPGGFTPDGEPVGPKDEGFWRAALFATKASLEPDAILRHYQTYLGSPPFSQKRGDQTVYGQPYNDYENAVVGNAMIPIALQKNHHVTLTGDRNLTADPPAMERAPAPKPPAGNLSWKSLNQLIRENTPQGSTTYTRGMLEAVWRKAEKDSLLQDAVGKLAYFSREYKKDITAQDLQALEKASKDNDLLETLNMLPEILKWQK